MENLKLVGLIGNRIQFLLYGLKLFWDFKIESQIKIINANNDSYFDSFASWFVIVGTTTVIVKMLSHPITSSNRPTFTEN